MCTRERVMGLVCEVVRMPQSAFCRDGGVREKEVLRYP